MCLTGKNRNRFGPTRKKVQRTLQQDSVLQFTQRLRPPTILPIKPTIAMAIHHQDKINGQSVAENLEFVGKKDVYCRHPRDFADFDDLRVKI